MRLDGEDRRGHRVLEDRLRGPLAAAHPAVQHGEVRHHEVDRVVAEARGELAQDVAQLLVVVAGVLGGRLGDELGRPHRVARATGTAARRGSRARPSTVR